MDARRKPKITISEQPVLTWNRGQKAMFWRQHVMRMTREQLAAVTYYGIDAIMINEMTSSRRETAAEARYRLSCELAHRHKFPDDKTPFNWGISI